MTSGQEHQTLETLVTAVASELMAVDGATVVASSQWVLRELVSYFRVDLSFLRRNDHDRGATVLVAEWPPRPNVPDPDPLGVVFFAEADSVFASTEHLSQVMITRPDLATDDYQRRVHGGSGVMGVSSATVPLLSRAVTTGVLGFIKYGDREWTQAEVNALKAIASLLAQMQARIDAEERLRYLAYHDELTGLSNRRALIDHLRRRLAPGELGPVAILFLDLDRLKAMNDFLGHAAGDEFLQSVATRLRTHTRPGDVVARLGGDEIVVVLGPPTGSAEAEQVAMAVQNVVNEPVRLGGEEVSRTVSIGVAVADPGECTVSDLLGQADQAVMAAKAQGGNGIVAFTEQMRAQNEVRTDIELHLRGAIHDDSLVLHYQPEIDLRTGQLLGAEALVRWRHPTRGLLQPDSFIGVAEATNLAGELGRWVLRAACAQLSRWQNALSDLNFCLRVNVSPAQLITLDFVTDVAQTLDENNVEGRYLSLEITEHAVVSDLHRALETLQHLAEIGIQVAIDDFGTGYSSLAQLKALPVSTLKIDRGFVQELGSNPDDLAIVRSIVGLAASFGLDTVAEGVATQIAARTLVELGCFRAQGYLIGMPVPAEEFWPMLQRGCVSLSSLGLGAGDPVASLRAHPQ
jgi:diguanylate cyclase (GGDEF)-like protein